jgi:hypothetical protein
LKISTYPPFEKILDPPMWLYQMFAKLQTDVPKYLLEKMIFAYG